MYFIYDVYSYVDCIINNSTTHVYINSKNIHLSPPFTVKAITDIWNHGVAILKRENETICYVYTSEAIKEMSKRQLFSLVDNNSVGLSVVRLMEKHTIESILHNLKQRQAVSYFDLPPNFPKEVKFINGGQLMHFPNDKSPEIFKYSTRELLHIIELLKI